MPRVLVLVEHEDGVTKKVTYEMLTKARDLGEPVALFVGEGLEQAREGLARHGATAVYATGGDNRLPGTLTGALEAATDRAEPAAVLVAATPLGKDAGATTEVVDFAPRPPRQAGQQVKDPGDGSAAVELADFLAGHKFI
ncbi:MAG: hypothetical protein ACJ75E_19300 [Actinomycetes bacterium]